MNHISDKAESMSSTESGVVQRRTIVRGAAWSIPVIAVAAGMPAATASTGGPVEGFRVDGTCGLLGTLGPGFTVTAGTSPIPVGTQIVLQSTSVVTVNLVSLSGQGLANVELLSSNRIGITLTQAIPAEHPVAAQHHCDHDDDRDPDSPSLLHTRGRDEGARRTAADPRPLHPVLVHVRHSRALPLGS